MSTEVAFTKTEIVTMITDVIETESQDQPSADEVLPDVRDTEELVDPVKRMIYIAAIGCFLVSLIILAFVVVGNRLRKALKR